MSTIGLVSSGSVGSSILFAGLVYQPSSNGSYRVKFDPLSLNDSVLNWLEITPGYQPARMVLVDQKRTPVSLPFRTNTDINLYLALDLGDHYAPLKIVGNNVEFVDQNPDELTVRVNVPAGKNFRWNDVRTRTYLRVGDQPLLNLINSRWECSKIYLSPYFDFDLNANASTIILESHVPVWWTVWLILILLLFILIVVFAIIGWREYSRTT